ncbi:tRNA lysidine(34) synthetase TilS [Abiotrophia defectiva]|uniref:tRNA lysidine(34) synthetase TilS n=1 Tax=Abiotrophia defectiva TaxID=46125 RepID=UPI0026EA6C34|nr:tRNA lysidine(34) synthetase TilS [Abiotrophia defectiva]
MEKLMREVKAQLESWPAWLEAKTVVLAVSGGVDSMVMLRLMNELNQLRQYNHLQLVVAHFNHKLRPESDYEATAIKNIVAEYGCIYFATEWGEPATTNVEAQARDARYQFFAEVIRTTEADVLMTAHHLNDVAETFLMRMIRGTSIRGLQGIRGCYQRLMSDPSGHTVMPTIIRPFIGVTKAELEAYAEKFNVTYFEDASNYMDHFVRNRFRHTYIPQLMQENPQLLQNLLTIQQQIQDSYTVQYADYLDLEPQLLMYSTNHYWLLYIPAFLALPEAKFNMYLRIFFEERLIEDVPAYNRDLVGQLQQMMRNRRDPNQRLQLGHGWVAVKRYDYVQILPEEAGPKAYFGQRLILSRLNHWYALDGGAEAGIFAAHQVSPEMREAAEGWAGLHLSQAQETAPLNFQLRQRQDGDQVAISDELGQVYHKKVGRILMDLKLPSDERNQIKVLVDEKDEIVWLGPVSNSPLSRGPQTDKITHIFLYRKTRQ